MSAHLDSSGWPVQPVQLIVLLPALAAALSLLLVRRARVPAFVLALLGALTGLVAAGLTLAQQQTGRLPAPMVDTIGALPLGNRLRVPLQLDVDRLAVLLCVTVAVVTLVVQLFSRWYLREDRRYAGFAATVGLFAAAMQLVVLSDDVLLTILGWELMGWCSYLLIGHESERKKARRAAYKAFLVTRVADAPFAIGLIALATAAHSTSISGIVRYCSMHSGTLVTGALIAVIVGVAGKSAQVPFQDWLPDAMEGPTPASALIHAATMVAAGTVVLARFAPLLERSDTARLVLVLVAGVSTVLAGALAYAQTDLKRLLAWSTVSQIGLMLLGLAILPPGKPGEDSARGDLALQHLVGHASFKSLLFLTFGWLSVLVGGTVVARMSGATRAHPATRGLVAVGLLALAGVPPTVGFVGKDLIVDESAVRAVDGDLVSRIAFFALALSVALTAAYCMRAWLVLDHRSAVERHAVLDVVDDSIDVQRVGIVEMFTTSAQVDRRGREVRQAPAPVRRTEPTQSEPADPTPDAASRLGLRLLALVAVVGGLLAGSPLLHIDWQHPTWLLIAATLLLIAAVAVLVRVQSLGTSYGDAAARLPLSVRSAADRGLGVDAWYVALTRPVLALAHLVAAGEQALERAVRGSVTGVRALGSTGARLQNGTPTVGLIAVACGIVAVGLIGISLW